MIRIILKQKKKNAERSEEKNKRQQGKQSNKVGIEKRKKTIDFEEVLGRSFVNVHLKKKCLDKVSVSKILVARPTAISTQPVS